MVFNSYLSECSPNSVVDNVPDCDFEVSKFKLQSCYYFHIRTNTLGKGMNPLISQVMGGARGVMVIIVGNGHDDTSSNTGRDSIFT